MTVVAVLTTNCHVSENLNIGPETSHMKINNRFTKNIQEEPRIEAAPTENLRNHSCICGFASPLNTKVYVLRHSRRSVTNYAAPLHCRLLLLLGRGTDVYVNPLTTAENPAAKYQQNRQHHD